jgi:hypothetical protein
MMRCSYVILLEAKKEDFDVIEALLGLGAFETNNIQSMLAYRQVMLLDARH